MFTNLFSISTPVDRVTYATVGLTLGVLKYLIESISVWLLTGLFYSPIDFVNPWLSSRAPFLHEASLISAAWLLFTIPFAWIAIAMSIRRAADVGVSPWFGLVMLVPLVNLIAMSVLAILPSGLLRRSAAQIEAEQKHSEQLAQAFAPPTTVETALPLDYQGHSRAGTVAKAVALGCVTQVVVGMLSVWLLAVYGFILFFATPVVAGAVTGFVLNRRRRANLAALFGVIVLMNLLSFVLMLCLGLDGAICLLIAFPLLCPLSFLGAIVGSAMATAGLRPGTDERPGMIMTMIALPFCLILERLDNHRPLHSVTTSIVIAAPPQVVWDHVIAFPEITSPPAWYFKLGIAAPMRARIDGHGVGAIRHCEFTTGEFIEPITVWESPSRLGFDVTSQPLPMSEWTPFTHLHPPHLDSGFVSRRGEFRLEAVAGGTRLHGTTWYEIDVRPRLYWKCWADQTIHAIHRRVLEHIADVSMNRGQSH